MHLERVKECLKPIIERAAEKNVRLGIEGRRGYEEIPSEREIPLLLDEIAAPHVGYWHDMGHIQIKENLGFLDHAEWLSTIAPRTIGCHMQDVLWPGQDHQPPFLGDMRNLERLARMLPGACQIVWELSPRRPAEEVAQSLAIWKDRFGE
jgi:sugar phosphate isomerase/epimerase